MLTAVEEVESMNVGRGWKWDEEEGGGKGGASEIFNWPHNRMNGGMSTQARNARRGPVFGELEWASLRHELKML